MTFQKKRKREGSVYIAVTGTALLVSLISMTAMHLARLELRTATALQDRTYARSLAQSSVEFAVANIDYDSNWRSNYNHDELNTTTPFGFGSTLRYKFLDPLDGILNNDSTQPVVIQGRGEYGTTIQVYSVTYAPSITTAEQVGPLQLRSFSDENSSSNDNVDASKWWGQYFLPSLPVEAVSWTVTNVKVRIKKSGAVSGTINFGLSLPDGSHLPGTLIETTAVNESQLPGSFEWYDVTFSRATSLDPNVGLCFTLTTCDTDSANIKYESDGVTEPDTHMLSGGSGSWTASAADKSLYYRIYGVYRTASGGSGEFTITPGSWKTAEATN